MPHRSPLQIIAVLLFLAAGLWACGGLQKSESAEPSPPPSQDETEVREQRVVSPTARVREENKLREVWKEEHPTAQARAKALFDAVEATGIEPYEVPDRFPPIDREEVRLVCWLFICAEG